MTSGQRAGAWAGAACLAALALQAASCGDGSGGSAVGGAAGGGGTPAATAGGPTGHGGHGGIVDAGGSGAGGAGGLGGAAGAGGGAPSDEVTLLEQLGAFFTPSPAEPMRRYDFGVDGTVYTQVTLELDVEVGDWQPEIPDPGNIDRTEHILFGLFRAHQPSSYQRYLMGAAAVTFASKAPHFRMFGRTSIGQGYTTYTQWSQTYPWQQGATYHLACQLDGVAHQQQCDLLLAGGLESHLQGAVDYLDPAAHLSSGFYVELGTANLGNIETSPMGWTFSNLVVTATLAP